VARLELAPSVLLVGLVILGGVPMSALPVLVAFRTSWVGFLILMGCVFVAWFLYRVVTDTITRFREEFLDDFSDRRQDKSRREGRNSGRA